MRTITDSIRQVLEESPSMAEALAEGILNYSAVARKLRPQLESEHMKSFTDGAIVMALKTLAKTTASGRSKLHAKGIVKSITVQSNLVEYAFSNSPSLQKVQQKILKLSESQDGVYAYFTRGLFDTALIVSDSLEAVLKSETVSEKLIQQFSSLSAICIRFDPAVTEVPGVYYPFFQALAWHSINYIQVVSGFAELAFVVDDKEVDKAFVVLKSLTRK